MDRKPSDMSIQSNGGHSRQPHVDRRVSRRRNDVRPAKIYEASSNTTIRAVTPDSSASVGTEITALPSPTSFLPQGPNRSQLQDPPISVSNTDEEGTADNRRRKAKKKSRYKDTNTQSDTSPNSFFTKTRKRLNSITTTTTTTTTTLSSRQDDPAFSIGFPSVVQASVFPDLQDMNHQLPKTPRRTFSSDTAITATASTVRSPLDLESDSGKILKLMKTLCGRMHGILFYRPIGTTSWHSGYCAINVAPGSLVRQTRGVVTQVETLIPDLRGCTVRTHYDSSTLSTHLSVVLPVSGFGYQLRPSVPETFESWLAALLCWQPLKPKGIYNKLAKPQSISISDKTNTGNRRLSDMSSSRSTAVVKSSQMLLWDGALPTGSYRHQVKRIKIGPYEQHSWRRVNCTLHEHGTLRLLAEENAMPIRSLKLNSLARCAIQRLDESVLGVSHCIAIHTQYTVNSAKVLAWPPLFLALSTRVAFEAWFVLLQAMTVPELYGPEGEHETGQASTSYNNTRQQMPKMFRIERSLRVKIIEAKLIEARKFQDQQQLQYDRPPRPLESRGAAVYADVMLGRDLRARTVSKPFSNSIFWAEEFCLADMPSILSRVSIVLKMGNPDEREWVMTPKSEYDTSTDEEDPSFEAIEVALHDPVYGKIDVSLSELEQERFVEKWWPLLDNNGASVGQVLIKLSLEEDVVLLESEYAGLSRHLHNFDNSLTAQLGQVLGTELKHLSDILLDIFQASDKAEEWINNLIEEEIDGIYREQPPNLRMRFSGRIHSNDSYESAEHRELLVRDLSRSATMEANLLFRGNSLVTKALDAHMRRLGKDYLERTLGEKLRAIVTANPNCEVDPNKVNSNEQLERNWSNLIAHTSDIWHAIAVSVQKCPNGIRNILKHIGSCAEDRYGSFIRTVKYTSVSGFLFLRLFCPCILNPKLFGILDDHPPERTRRTLTLIAKSLIVLANLSKFGQKEPWMEPMNRFLTAATPEFKQFIDEICSWDVSQVTNHEPQYQAATQVKQRLPPMSREGLSSLPFLLDAPRSLATLVDLWMDCAPSNIIDTGIDDSVRAFHKMCVALKQKAQDCLASAEAAAEPSSNLERLWQKMLSEQPKNHETQNPFDEMYTDNDITALPQPPDTHKYSSRTTYTSNKVVCEEEEGDYPREPPTRTLTSSTNSSNLSFEAFDDYRNRHGLRSSEGPPKGRFLEITNHRKGAS